MLVVPGIGTIHGFRAINHANAIWAGVAPFLAPNVVRSAMIGWFVRHHHRQMSRYEDVEEVLT
jgi:hypothetical protein